MKYRALYISALLLLSMVPAVEVLAQKQEYKLVWADEFDKNGVPDSANWNYESGFVRNEELQWYQQENAECKNGILIIEGRREEKVNPMYQEGNDNWRRKRSSIEYTSSDQFHVWRMDWTEEFIALYVDDILLNKVMLDALVNKDGNDFNPFKQPHYMLLNLAIGGQNGGNPEKTLFPRKFEVDYVRVYQKIVGFASGTLSTSNNQ